MEILHEDNRLVRFNGRLDANSSGHLDQVLTNMAADGGDIILDLSACPYLSSAGIRILLKTTRLLHSSGDELIITGVTTEVLHVLEAASLTTVLHLEKGVEEAIAVVAARREKSAGTSHGTLQDHHLLYHPVGDEPLTGTYAHAKEVLSYHEMGFAIGFGSFSASDESARDCADLFTTMGNCAVFFPAGNPLEADFRLISEPDTTGLLVNEILSFGLHPSGILKVPTPGRFPLGVLSRAVREVEQIGLSRQSVILAIVVDQDTTHPSVSLVLANNDAVVSLVNEAGMKQFGELLVDHATSPLTGITIRLAHLEPLTDGTRLHECLNRNLTYENILSLEPIQPDSFLQNPVAWLFHASRFEEDNTRRLAMEVKPGTEFESPNPFLARMLYNDSSKICIEPLHGGYTAKTYHVASYDHEGRRMRPTVMKVANRDLISRESERGKKYAQPYILNNCAMVMGSARFEETMAIRYNFVGIGGENSQLKWLTHYYLEKEIDFLGPLFDKIFLKILKPWYGQAVRKVLYPFQDHDPTLTFFPHIYQTARELFSISADDEYLQVPELDRPILNPYRFLKHEYPRKRNWGIDYYSGICHGDLNMQNILLDELMNVYLIDFSETRPRSVISDFARLEAIFLIDNAPLGDEADLQDYLQFIQRFYSIPRLDELPEIHYQGKHPEAVKKNASLAIKMRRYALGSTDNHPELLPYYMALLEWIMPIVCYTSLPLPQKRLAFLVSSLLTEKVKSAI